MQQKGPPKSHQLLTDQAVEISVLVQESIRGIYLKVFCIDFTAKLRYLDEERMFMYRID